MVVADSSANVGNNRETTSLYLEYSSDHDNVAGENFRLVSITKNQFNSYKIRLIDSLGLCLLHIRQA